MDDLDIGEKGTQRIQKDLEKRIRKEYKQAHAEITKTAKEYFEQFETEDAEMREKLKHGEITKKEYGRWRNARMVNNKRYTAMRDTIAMDYANADKIAAKLVGDGAKDAFALNANYGAFEVEKDSQIDTSFTLYNRDTVERLLRDDPDLLPLPKPDIPKELRWSKGMINSVLLQGILQGDSMQKIADRLIAVTGTSQNSAIRNARTMTMGAQNAGRLEAYKRGQAMGIPSMMEWRANLDDRTRHSHRQLDGERIEIGAKFSNGCRFPCDPYGRPEEIYNCRCRLRRQRKGFETDASDLSQRRSKLGDMSYEDWKKAKAKPAKAPSYYKPLKSEDFVNERFTEEDVQRINRRFASLDKKYHAKVTDIKTTLKHKQEEYDLYFANHLRKMKEDHPRMRQSTAERKTRELLGERPEKIDVWLGGNYNMETGLMTLNNMSINLSNGGIERDIEQRKDHIEHNKRRAEMGRRQRPNGNTGDTNEATFIHEYGHAIDATYNVRNDPRFLEFYNSLSEDEIIAGVSEYASENEKEFIAECFCESFMGETQGEISKRFMKILEQIIEEGIK